MAYGHDMHGAPIAQHYGAAAIGAGSAAGYAGDAAARRPELAEQMDRMERTISEATNCLDLLESRLSDGLLRPSPPSTDKNQIGPASPSSGYACSLFQQVARMDLLCLRLNDIRNRLEA